MPWMRIMGAGMVKMKVLISLLVLIVALPFIVNIPDTQLLEKARNIIVAQPQHIGPEKDNGFYALLGFEAPVGKDIHEAGKDVSRVYSLSQSAKPPSFEFSLHRNRAPGPNVGRSSDVPRCIPEKDECLPYYSEKRALLTKLVDDNEVLLERYRSLNRYSSFQDTTKPAPWSPQIGVESGIFAGHLLTAGQAAILYSKGSVGEAFRLVVADIGLWRKILAGASDLPCKTYSLLALQLDYTLLGEMIDKAASRDKAFSIAENEGLLAPLSDKERSTDIVWDRQLQSLAWSLTNNRWPSKSGGGRQANISFLERFFCKRNATLNEAYNLFNLLKTMSVVEPAEVENIRVAFSNRLRSIAGFSPRLLYNPFGKRFLSSSFDERAGTLWNRDIHRLDQLIDRIRGKVKNRETRADERALTPAGA